MQEASGNAYLFILDHRRADRLRGHACGVRSRQQSKRRFPSPSASGAKVKIGFLVKQPDEPWFQAEWSAAEKAATENGFELLKIGTPDGEKVLSAIDNLAANGAKGFVICTPDVRLGPAIVAKAKANDLKLMTVDDQFVGPDGKAMADVPHLGVAARDVGHVSGQALADQFKTAQVAR